MTCGFTEARQLHPPGSASNNGHGVVDAGARFAIWCQRKSPPFASRSHQRAPVIPVDLRVQRTIESHRHPAVASQEGFSPRVPSMALTQPPSQPTTAHSTVDHRAALARPANHHQTPAFSPATTGGSRRRPSTASCAARADPLDVARHAASPPAAESSTATSTKASRTTPLADCSTPRVEHQSGLAEWLHASAWTPAPWCPDPDVRGLEHLLPYSLHHAGRTDSRCLNRHSSRSSVASSACISHYAPHAHSRGSTRSDGRCSGCTAGRARSRAKPCAW